MLGPNEATTRRERILWIVGGTLRLAAPFAAYAVIMRETTYFPVWAVTASPLVRAWSGELPLALLAAALAYAGVSRLASRRRLLAGVFVGFFAAYVAALVFHALFPETFYAGAGSLTGPAEATMRYASLLAWVVLGVVVWFGGETRPQCDPLAGIAGAECLTDRERDVVRGALAGRTIASIARELGISPSTAATYRTRACEKLSVESLEELRRRAADRPVDELDLGMPLAAPLCIAGVSAALLVKTCVVWLWNGYSNSTETLFQISAILLVPPIVVAIVARFRHLVIWAPTSLSRRMLLVLGALLAQGILLGGPDFPRQPLIIGGGLGLDLSFLLIAAAIAYPVSVLWLAARSLAPAHVLLDPLPDERDRCVLYLRGRGLRELEAQVALRIALGESASGICKELNVAPGTVNAYRAHAYTLLRVHSSRELAALLERDVGFSGQ